MWSATAMLALALSGTAAMPAAAFVARNDLVVEPTGRNSFAVPYRGKSGPGEFWCAAGDYVLGGLGLAPTTRIYRTSAPPRRSGEGMTFSLDPAGATASGLAIFGGQDQGLSATFAQSFCNADKRIRD